MLVNRMIMIRIAKYLGIAWLIVVSALSAMASSPVIPQAPDYKHIEREVNSEHSRYYYPMLVQKYNSQDTTMTAEEFHYYYYGYTFQEDYNPYRKSEFAHQIDHLYKQGRKLSVAEYENLERFARQTLNDNPFDLRQINIMIYALKGLNRYREAEVWQYRLDGLTSVILASGNGMSPETAWHVIHPSHEYIILNCKGMKGVDFVFVEPHYDYIEIERNTLKIEGCYFNVERITDVYNMKYCYMEEFFEDEE